METSKMFNIFPGTSLRDVVDRQREKERNKITSWKWGWRINPVTKFKQFLNGMDLPVKQGTQIFSPYDFIVKKVAIWGATKEERKNNISGNFLQLTHPNNSEITETRYAHLCDWDAELKVKLDKWCNDKELVKAGTLIGYVGTTGRSTGPHLHFIMLVKKPYIFGGLSIRHVDPFPYILSCVE